MDNDEARFEEAVKKVAKAANQLQGSWSVRQLKVGSGYYPHFTPSGYGPETSCPTFEAEAEAQAWIDRKIAEH